MDTPSPGTRDEMVAVVERFLDCMAASDLEHLPVRPGLIVQSPLIPKLHGQAALEYVKAVATNTSAIDVVRHVVEGDHVATLTENQTGSGPLSVFALFRIEAGCIAEARVFYDTRRLRGST